MIRLSTLFPTHSYFRDDGIDVQPNVIIYVHFETTFEEALAITIIQIRATMMDGTGNDKNLLIMPLLEYHLTEHPHTQAAQQLLGKFSLPPLVIKVLSMLHNPDNGNGRWNYDKGIMENKEL